MKKFFCAVLAVALACGLCGCEKKSGKLTVKFNDVEVTSPLTVEKLGDDYSLTYDTLLNYKGEPVVLAGFDEPPGNSKKTIKSVSTNAASAYSDFLSVNGITIGSSSDDVLSAIGEPSRKDDIWGWVYHENGKPENDNYLIITFENERVVWIYVHIP